MMMVKCFVLQLWHMLIVQWRLCCSAGDHTVTLSLLCELFCNKCVYLSLSLRVKLPDKDFHSWILTEVETPILRGFFFMFCFVKLATTRGHAVPVKAWLLTKVTSTPSALVPLHAAAASPHSHFCLCQSLKSRKLLQYSADDRWYCHSSAITQTPGLQQRLIYDCAASLGESWAPEFRSQPPRAQKANKTVRSHIGNTLIFSLKTAKQFRSMSRSCRRINVFHAITNSVGRCLDCVGSEDRDSGV